MGVKVTGQFEPAGAFSIVDGKDVSGHITGSNISGSATGTGSFGKLLGDGSSLTGIASYTVANSSNNRILTSVDSSNGNAEANLTFDGSTLGVTGAITSTTTGSFSRVEIGGGGSVAGWDTKLWLKGTTGAATTLHIESTNVTAVSAVRFETNGNNWYWAAGGSSQGYFPNKFYLYNEGGSVANPITICNDGKIGLAGRRSPTYDFDIPGTFRATNKSYFENNVLISPNWGRLGVALGSLTAEPSSSLHVRFSLDDTATSDALRNVTQTNVNYHTFVNGLILENTNDAANTGGKVHIRSAGSRAASVFLYGENAGSAGNSRMSLWTESGSAAYERISLESNGDVLFGTTVTKISGSATSTGSFGHLRGSVITSEDGNIKYKAGTQTFQNAAGTKTMAVFNGANSVDLHYNNSKKFETTNTGVSVVGGMVVSGDSVFQGSLTAKQLIVSSSVLNVTQSFSSGSTIFGNSTDDTHLFTGSVNITGSATATSFIGDGSQLTGLTPASITTYNSAADNRIITSVNSTTVQGESNLTFDGSTLVVNGAIDLSGDIDVDGTLEADAITVNGSTLSSVIQGTTVNLASKVTINNDTTSNLAWPVVFHIRTGGIGTENALGDDTGVLTYTPGFQTLTVPKIAANLTGAVTADNNFTVTGQTGSFSNTLEVKKYRTVTNSTSNFGDIANFANGADAIASIESWNAHNASNAVARLSLKSSRSNNDTHYHIARGSYRSYTSNGNPALELVVGTALGYNITHGTDPRLTMDTSGVITVHQNFKGLGTISGSFIGNGSGLTGISSYTVANSANNRILTSVDSSNGNAEANLTFDGNQMDLSTTGHGTIHITGGTGKDANLKLQNNSRLWIWQNDGDNTLFKGAGTLHLYDGTASATRIAVNSTGLVEIPGGVSGSAVSTGSFGRVEIANRSKFDKAIGIGTEIGADTYTILQLDSNANTSGAARLRFSNNGTVVGSIYGGGSNFALMDNDDNWAYRIITDSSHQWYINNAEKMRLTNSGYLNLGIVSTGPDTPLHVSEGEVSGVGSNADAMVTFEKEGAHLNENYVQFLTRTAGHSGLIFGDADSNDVARIQYRHDIDKMSI